jgi:putative chitinase
MNPLRQAAFIGQCGHECGNFRILEENLNYRAEALQKLWPKRFDATKAQTCAKNPKLIANTVYSNRMGNRDEASGDGFRFRGRGCIQLTGSANYHHAGKALGVDLIMQPELVATPMYAALTAGWFWDTQKLNQYADSKDYKTMTKKINGGFIGLDDRIHHIEKALQVLA